MSGLYCPQASTPLARTGTSSDPAQALGPGWTIHVVMSEEPLSHSSKGGIVITASSRMTVSSAVMS